MLALRFPGVSGHIIDSTYCSESPGARGENYCWDSSRCALHVPQNLCPLRLRSGFPWLFAVGFSEFTRFVHRHVAMTGRPGALAGRRLVYTLTDVRELRQVLGSPLELGFRLGLGPFRRSAPLFVVTLSTPQPRGLCCCRQQHAYRGGVPCSGLEGVSRSGRHCLRGR
jgi:hypothetical protein